MLREVDSTVAPRILFLGNYADPQVAPPPTPGALSRHRYHQEILGIMIELGLDVCPSNDPEDLFRLRGDYGFVFSLYNRLPIRSAETYVSAVCEYLKTPYLGARPELRSVAADKHLFKMMARALRLPTPEWITLDSTVELGRAPEFPPPYLIKPRSGANSEGIDGNAIQDDWPGAVHQARNLLHSGCRVIIEQFIEGVNLTLPVLSDSRPLPLSAVETISSHHRGILTSAEKQQDNTNLAFEVLADKRFDDVLREHAGKVYSAARPVDYFRLDYRYNQKTQEISLLEMNICCDLSSFGSFIFSATSQGLTQKEVLSHILATSLGRQQA